MSYGQQYKQILYRIAAAIISYFCRMRFNYNISVIIDFNIMHLKRHWHQNKHDFSEINADISRIGHIHDSRIDFFLQKQPKH